VIIFKVLDAHKSFPLLRIFADFIVEILHPIGAVMTHLLRQMTIYILLLGLRILSPSKRDSCNVSFLGVQ
jgi:hypothetical protein